jgi:hypothetical protein
MLGARERLRRRPASAGSQVGSVSFILYTIIILNGSSCRPDLTRVEATRRPQFRSVVQEGAGEV